MTVEDRSRVDEVVEILEELDSMYVVVGVLSKSGGELIKIAAVQEFGATIPVTDKMRGFFAYRFGINLKASTTEIKIPERSYIRSSFDDNETKLMELGDMLSGVLDGDMSPRNFYEALGQTCVGTIQDYMINEVKSPPNSGLTIANKGSSNPLVDTGRLVGSIDYEIKYR